MAGEVVGFAVYRTKGSSDTVVAQGVEDTIAGLQRSYGDLKIQQFASTVDHTRSSYKMSMMTLLESAGLTIIVVFFFLRNWRATLVAAIALPLSILPTFAAMALLGYTLNSITLLALTLVIGILVDDAIVEIENIERHLDMGKRPFRAAIDASSAIGFAVVAITLPLWRCFFRSVSLAATLDATSHSSALRFPVAVLASMLVARLATPLLAAYLMQPRSGVESVVHARHAQPGKLMARYLRLLEWSLQHRRAALGAGVAFLLGSLLLIPLLPTGFLPVSDLSLTQVNVEMTPGVPLTPDRPKTARGRQQDRPTQGSDYRIYVSWRTGCCGCE